MRVDSGMGTDADLERTYQKRKEEIKGPLPVVSPRPVKHKPRSQQTAIMALKLQHALPLE